jgi:hypothetical protein
MAIRLGKSERFDKAKHPMNTVSGSEMILLDL